MTKPIKNGKDLLNWRQGRTHAFDTSIEDRGVNQHELSERAFGKEERLCS